MADLLIDANARATAARSGARPASRRTPASPASGPGTGRHHQGHRRKLTQAHPDGQRRAAAGPPVPGPRRHDPPLRHRPDRRIHLQPGRTRHPPGQGPAAHLVPGAPCSDWPTSRSSSPTCPPPPNGASTPSMPSPGYSPTDLGSRPQQRTRNTATSRPAPSQRTPADRRIQRQRAISHAPPNGSQHLQARLRLNSYSRWYRSPYRGPGMPERYRRRPLSLEENVACSCPNGVKLSLHRCKIAVWRGQGSR